MFRVIVGSYSYMFVIVKLNLELDAFVIREQSIFIQLLTTNIGGVFHAPILDK